MISMIGDAAVALSRWIELSILGKATIMLLIGLTVARLSARASASVRHLLLTATFATVLALPLVAWAAPALMIGVPASQTAESVTPPKTMTPQALVMPVTPSDSVPIVRTSWLALAWITIVRLVWLAGSLFLLLQLFVELLRLFRIQRDGIPWPERREFVESLAVESGIRRRVEILMHEGILAPLTYGALRPVILLPADARQWSSAELRRAIVHELEHVRRGDWVIQLAARITCVFYWFHPLVWIGFRWLSVEAERSCDDAVLRGAERTEYAEQLLGLARRLSKAHARPALGLSNRSDLSKRVSALLDGTQRRGRAGLVMAASALSVACLLVLVIAPVRAVTQSSKEKSQLTQTISMQGGAKKRIGSALERALLEAAADGDNNDIDELLRAGVNVNCVVEGDGSPLIAAAREGHLDTVRFLLDRGADPNQSVQGDGSPLIMASREGHTDIVALLLDRGALIDQIVPGDENALIQASGNGRLDVVKLLVERGADVNARVSATSEIEADLEVQNVFVKDLGKGGSVKLIVAPTALTRKIEAIRGELKAAEEQRRTKQEWRTPLIMAERGGYKDVVSFLRAAGARE
ncbi:MAG TPA: M56 family metallopeptidase [Blastocatellia bacterium]|nr:M56 family metallopeptidase [Blastocatellia bacterium]